MSERNEKAREVKDRILQAATRLFADFGYGGVSVQQVAEEAGVSKQLLLYHFGSKTQLREAVLKKLLAQWQTIMPLLVRSPMEPMIDRLEAFMRENPDSARFMMRELITDEGLREQIVSETSPWRDFGVQWLGQRQATGELSEQMDPVGLLHGVAMVLLSAYAVLKPGGSEEDDRVRAAVLRELVKMQTAWLQPDWEKAQDFIPDGVDPRDTIRHTDEE